MEPFCIRWRFLSPAIIPVFPIHLDGLLSWCRVQQAIDAGTAEPFAEQHDLPLERYIAPSGEWCFKASWIDFRLDDESPSSPELLHTVKRSSVTEVATAWDSGLLGTKVPYYDPQRGLHKAGSFAHRRQWYGEAVAYGVGDIAALRPLLTRITSIGKLRRRANGRVMPAIMAPDRDAEARWMRRALPLGAASIGDGVARMRTPLCAPYWQRERAVDALVPTDL